MAIVESQWLVARNPATGEELARIEPTAPEAIAGIVARAKEAQRAWGATTWSERRELLRRWWSVLASEADDWARSLTDEIGKPGPEAMAEVVTTLDALRWTVKHGGKALKPERIGPGWQRLLMIPAAHLTWKPLGVIGMIGTWNYPLFLNAPPIVHALAAGNAVVWKPSELAARLGLKLQSSIEAAGFPEGLVAAVIGGPEVGQALVEADLDKGMFTGGVENGRRVLTELARRGVPAIVELSGFDAALVLPDAPRESTVRALAWAAFVACGQTCVAVKRLYVVGDPLPWARDLVEQARGLRLGDPARDEVDIGPLISSAARDRFDRFIQAAVAAGARVLLGGAPADGPGWFYQPTVLLADTPEPEAALAGCFGPVVIVRGVPNAEAAVAAANASPFGLAGSLWASDFRTARALADRLEVGMVGINEAVLPTAHAAAPFGGMKASGFGRVHGVLGLREFAQPQTVHARSPRGPRPQVYPYSPRMGQLLAFYRKLFH